MGSGFTKYFLVHYICDITVLQCRSIFRAYSCISKVLIADGLLAVSQSFLYLSSICQPDIGFVISCTESSTFVSIDAVVAW